MWLGSETSQCSCYRVIHWMLGSCYSQNLQNCVIIRYFIRILDFFWWFWQMYEYEFWWSNISLQLVFQLFYVILCGLLYIQIHYPFSSFHKFEFAQLFHTCLSDLSNIWRKTSRKRSELHIQILLIVFKCMHPNEKWLPSSQLRKIGHNWLHYLSDLSIWWKGMIWLWYLAIVLLF